MRNKSEGSTKQARSLRTHASLPEVLLWKWLRAKQIGVQVRRQYAVGGYVLDFYVPCVRLCIEVDGRAHDLKMERDSQRDSFLEEQAIHVLRVQAKDVLADAKTVAEQIRMEVLKLSPQ